MTVFFSEVQILLGQLRPCLCESRTAVGLGPPTSPRRIGYKLDDWKPSTVVILIPASDFFVGFTVTTQQFC